MNQVWSSAERDFIRDNAGKLKDKELAAKLTQMTGRLVSLQAVRKQRQKMGISKNPGRGKCEIVGQEKETNAPPVKSTTDEQETVTA